MCAYTRRYVCLYMCLNQPGNKAICVPILGDMCAYTCALISLGTRRYVCLYMCLNQPGNKAICVPIHVP